MDTTFTPHIFHKGKFVEITFLWGVLLAIVMAHGLFGFAAEKIAHLNIPIKDTGQTIEQMNAEFNESVRQRYPQGAIKTVEDGVKHIKVTKYYNGQPVKLNIVEVNLKIAKDLRLTPALASDQTLQSRRTITTIAKNNNALVALNGTFFKPQTGVPLGTLMINGKMYTGPIYDRVSMGIFEDGSFDMGRVQLNAEIKSAKETIRVDNINQPRMLSTLVLVYTPEWGKLAPPSPKYGMQMAVVDGKVISSGTARLEIPQDGFVIVGPTDELSRINIDKKVRLDIKTLPQWDKVEHIISGGPYLVREGEVFVDIAEQKLLAIGGRNPRSAIGYTASGNIVLIAVDGREYASVGMTLTQLANYLKSIGCVNAMNLDGGGSTVMYVNGQVVNRPAQAGGIPVSNAIALVRAN